MCWRCRVVVGVLHDHNDRRRNGTLRRQAPAEQHFPGRHSPAVHVDHDAERLGNPSRSRSAASRLCRFPSGLDAGCSRSGRGTADTAGKFHGYLPSCIVEQAIADTEALRTTDFGEPGVTDQGGQTVDYTPQTGDPIKLYIYAPGFDEYITAEQRAARDRFEALNMLLATGFVKN